MALSKFIGAIRAIIHGVEKRPWIPMAIYLGVFALFVLASAGDIMGLSSMTKIFRSVSKAVGMMTALLFCVLTVFIIATGVILMTGRG